MSDWMRNRGDVVADFRQYYGIDLPVDDGGDMPDLARMALLWSALPESSRTVRRLVPKARWTPTDYLLREIEHSSRIAVWQRTKDGAKGRNAPKPIQTPVERAANEERRDSALRQRGEIDRILGIE